MAYRGRGPSIKGGLKRGGGSGRGRSSDNDGDGLNLNIRLGIRRGIYVYYGDLLIWEWISLILIGIVIGIGVLALIFNYESQYIYDPIEHVKNNFIELQFVGLMLNGILLGIATAKRKNSKNAYKIFIATFFTLLASVIITAFGYINFIDKYNAETFNEMYTETVMKVEVTGDSKALFVQECKNLNEKFAVKVITICVIEYILIFMNILLFVKALKDKNKYEQIKKEDEVLFVEEINVKY